MPYVKEIGQNGLDSSSSTLIVTLSATAAASTNLIVARVCVDSGQTISSVADSRGNSWLVDKQQTTGPKCAICSTGQNTAALQSGDTVTFTLSGSSLARLAIIDEFSGYDVSAGRVDATQAATGTLTNRTAGTITTVTPNALIVCCYGAGVKETSWVKGAGFYRLHDDVREQPRRRQHASRGPVPGRDDRDGLHDPGHWHIDVQQRLRRGLQSVGCGRRQHRNEGLRESRGATPELEVVAVG
jgi:hypothetical protein